MNYWDFINGDVLTVEALKLGVQQPTKWSKHGQFLHQNLRLTAW